MNRSLKLYKLGQSIWFDNVDRSLIENGWLADQIDNKTIFGVTSNPSIFQKAISTGTTYSTDIQTMVWAGLSPEAIYENLVIADIQSVADLFSLLYQVSKKKDGYVSLEVDPALAYDADRTVREAKRLWQSVDRENLMIKIPATTAGISAIKRVISAGINVNVTLIFSTERYMQVIDAYYSGLEERIEKRLPIDHIHSVASFFISRMDVMIENMINPSKNKRDFLEKDLHHVLGKIGIQNALNAYAAFEESINAKRFQDISNAGGNFQRPLWASTGTKNPSYSDVLYIDKMVLPHTVNTVPPQTFKALLDHGQTEVISVKDSKKDFAKSIKLLNDNHIDIQKVFLDLEKEGVEKFISAQKLLLDTIGEASQRFSAQVRFAPGIIPQRMLALEEDRFIERFYQPDVSLFTINKEEEQEVLHRMGWIDAPEKSRKIIPFAEKLLKDVLADGFSHAVVLGMGGSSLAPEVFSEVFRKHRSLNNECLQLSILDSTDPDQITAKLKSIHLTKTLFIASSKSGTTAEMKSLVAYFMKLLREEGVQEIGKHFICITDPKTPLESFARENTFRHVFNADPNVGGRYSAMIAFGLVPAVFAGIDGNLLLDKAEAMRQKCARIKIDQNPAFILATILSEAYSQNIDKLTILADDEYVSFGSWLEQLVAESSGKNGKGLIPIDREPIVDPSKYSRGRIFYYLRQDGKYDQLVGILRTNGYNVLESQMVDRYDLSAEMYKWEIAIAAFCCMNGVNPFNQPNVQASKSLALKMIEEFRRSPEMVDGNRIFENETIALYTSQDNLHEFSDDEKILENIWKPETGDFYAINAFIPRTRINEDLLSGLRKKLIEKYSLPVTLGFGPRFLHSTGQLHKGGKNNGIFIVLTQKPLIDLEIPGEGINFSTLESAQALGDMQALQTHQRRVIRIHFKKKISAESLSLLI